MIDDEKDVILLPECVQDFPRRCGELSVTEAVRVEQEAGLQLLHWRDQTVEALQQLNVSWQGLSYIFWLLRTRR